MTSYEFLWHTPSHAKGFNPDLPLDKDTYLFHVIYTLYLVYPTGYTCVGVVCLLYDGIQTLVRVMNLRPGLTSLSSTEPPFKKVCYL